MLSRVAENLYWLARYIERAENTARLINVNTNLMLDLPKFAQPGWEPIVNILGLGDQYGHTQESRDERAALHYLISDRNNSASIISSLSMARENCRTIRDIIPREAWEQVNDIFIYAKEQSNKGLSKRGRYDYLKGIILRAQTMTGLLAGTMLHDEGYDFLKMGRNLERADMTLRIIDVRTEDLLEDVHEGLTPFENIQWMSVLKSLTAYQMYRRTIQARVRRKDVLMFLFQDKRFPRSFYHSISEVESCLVELNNNNNPLEYLKKLQSKIQKIKFETLDQEKLHKLIDEFEIGLGNVHKLINQTYFYSLSE